MFSLRLCRQLFFDFLVSIAKVLKVFEIFDFFMSIEKKLLKFLIVAIFSCLLIKKVLNF